MQKLCRKYLCICHENSIASTMQVAVFDTAFHQTMPSSAYFYALPFEYFEKFHVRKYGFHGTSVKYLVGEVRNICLTCMSRMAPKHLSLFPYDSCRGLCCGAMRMDVCPAGGQGAWEGAVRRELDCCSSWSRRQRDGHPEWRECRHIHGPHSIGRVSAAFRLYCSHDVMPH